MELVESMVLLGKKVTLINRSEKIMKTYDDEIRNLILEEVKQHDVEMYLEDGVEGVTGESTVTGVKTNQATYEADVVIVAISVKPNTEFLQETEIQQLKNEAIIVDEK